MLPSLNRSGAPLLITTFFPSVTAAELRAHFREIESAVEELGKVGVVVDLSTAPRYSRTLVKIAATEMNALFRRNGEKIIAVAHVIPAAPARALLASIQWLAPPPFPSLVTASYEDGKSWTSEQLKRVAAPSELAEVRNEAARAVSEHAPPTLVAIGRRLGMSRRTLQRRLHERGVTFGQIVDSVRREAALAAIKPTARISVQEVARACGFEDLKSFRRAFRKWTGLSPTDYRKRSS
jgi:AraC-like DNA-binding protein